MKKSSGFSLLELVTVISVTGILVAVAIPVYVNVQDDAKKAMVTQNGSALESGINLLRLKSIASNSSSVVLENNSAVEVNQFGVPFYQGGEVDQSVCQSIWDTALGPKKPQVGPAGAASDIYMIEVVNSASYNACKYVFIEDPALFINLQLPYGLVV
jgi:prepilin-type N-terminal cleavage/methylation domain-containing protein